MLSKPADCRGCILEDYKGGFAQPEGSGKSGVLIIGEALGENEKNEGLPFRPYAESGSALQTAINLLRNYQINYTREDFGFWNLISCQPPFNKLEDTKFEEGAISHCRQAYFNQIITYYKPKVIFALGNLPLKHLVPEIEALKSKLKERLQEAKQQKNKEEEKHIAAQLSKLRIGALRGYRFKSVYGVPLVPSFHPSFITRGERVLLGVLLRDLMFAIEVADGKWGEYKFENYIENPSTEEIQKFFNYCKNHPKLTISYDIETPFTTLEVDESTIEFGQQVRSIDSIQFSVPVNSTMGNGTIKTRSIFLDWNKDLEGIVDILRLQNPKVGWNNWKFDETNLKYHLGEGVLGGTRYDAMWCFKHLNADFRKIGRGLQFAANFYVPNLPAWKHLSESEPKKYGLIDVDATLKTFVGLQNQMQAARNPAPNSKNLWKGYEDDIVKLFPILQAITRRGFPINLEDRDAFKKELIERKKQVLEELQELYPTQLRRPDPQLGYKNVPKEVGELEAKFHELYCDISSPEYVVFLDEKQKELLLAKFIEQNTRRRQEDYEERKTKKDVQGQTGLVVREFKIEDKVVKRYCRLDRFKPKSPDQIKAYIRFKGYKPKKVRKGKKETESADKNAMYELYEEYKDPFFLKCGFHNELNNIVSTYIRGWKTDEEGRVHSTFLPIPATGQLSCSPNIQNAPGHGTRYNSDEYVALAQRFRKCIQAKMGHTFVACVTGDTRILRKDLTWGFAEDIKIGDELWGVDEFPRNKPTTIRSGRYVQESKVQEVGRLDSPCLKIITDKGTITCSKDHRLLQRYQGKAIWNRADSLRVGEEVSFFVRPWYLEHDFEAGYLAGFLDGEGYVGNEGRGIKYGQNDGEVSDFVKRLIESKGYQIKIESDARACKYYAISGEQFSWLRFAGSIRPKRLLPKIIDNLNGMAYWCRGSKSAKILRIEDAGTQEVIAIKTSTKTYISEGFLSHNCDYVGFHAVMLGAEADDYAASNGGGDSAANYIRLAKLGIHDFLTAYMVRNEYSSKKRLVDFKALVKGGPKSEAEKKRDETLEYVKDLDKWLEYDDNILSEKLSWIKKNHKHIRDSQAKPAVHGIGFGMGIRKFFKLNKHAFSSLEEPRRILALLRRLFPDVFIWQDYIKELAANQTYLLSRYGYIRFFWDIYDWRLIPAFRAPKSEYEKIIVDKKNGKIWSRTDGQQIKEAIAFLPANNAFGKKKEAMRDMEDLGYLDKFGLILDNHDELLFECPDEFVDECIIECSRIMEAPARHIITKRFPEGISCPVGAKIGKNWGAFDKDINLGGMKSYVIV